MGVPILDPTDPCSIKVLVEGLEQTATYYYRGYEERREPLELDDESHRANLRFVDKLYEHGIELYELVASKHYGRESVLKMRAQHHSLDQFLIQMACKTGGSKYPWDDTVEYHDLRNVAECVRECAGILKEVVWRGENSQGQSVKREETKDT